jgi:hypothetical protein
MQVIPTPQTMSYDDAIAKYDAIMAENYAHRVAMMDQSDLLNYYAIHNLPRADQASILKHMSKWGGFNALAIRDGLKVFERSALLQRILSGRKPLAFAPPRRQGIPWYALIDEPGLHACSVDGVFRNRRVNRRTWNELIVVIEQCPWEILHANPKAGSLLDAQVRHQFPDIANPTSEKMSPILEATQIARSADGLSIQVTAAEISVRHGKWTQSIVLVSTAPTPICDQISHPLQAMQWSLDSSAFAADSASV